MRLFPAQLCPGGSRTSGCGARGGKGKVPSGHWAPQEPPLPLLSQTFYAISFLMVVVYAYEAFRTVQGWRGWHVAALQVGAPRPWCSGGGDPRAAPFPWEAPCVPAERGWSLELLGEPAAPAHRPLPPCRSGAGAWRVRGGGCPTSWPGRCRPPAPAPSLPRAGLQPSACPPGSAQDGRTDARDGQTCSPPLSLPGWCRRSRSWHR